MGLDGDEADDPCAGDDADAVCDQGDDRAQCVPKRALSDREAQQDDVPGHHRREHVEPKERDRVDRTRGEGQGDE